MRRALKQREEAKLQIVNQYESQDKVVKVRSEKLQKLKEIYMQQKADMEDLQADFQRQRECRVLFCINALLLLCVWGTVMGFLLLGVSLF